jgi:hypothetical protein
MYRWHKDKERSKRENIKHLRHVHDWPNRLDRFGFELDCECEFQVGRFRKSKGLGCRKRNCYVCKWKKILKIPTKKDRIANIIFKEELTDLDFRQ